MLFKRTIRNLFLVLNHYHTYINIDAVDITRRRMVVDGGQRDEEGDGPRDRGVRVVPEKGAAGPRETGRGATGGVASRGRRSGKTGRGRGRGREGPPSAAAAHGSDHDRPRRESLQGG